MGRYAGAFVPAYIGFNAPGSWYEGDRIGSLRCLTKKRAAYEQFAELGNQGAPDATESINPWAPPRCRPKESSSARVARIHTSSSSAAAEKNSDSSRWFHATKRDIARRRLAGLGRERGSPMRACLRHEISCKYRFSDRRHGIPSSDAAYRCGYILQHHSTASRASALQSTCPSRALTGKIDGSAQAARRERSCWSA